MNFSVLDWNIQGTKYFTKTDFKKVAPVLKKIEADIFCIQEGQELFTELKNIHKFNSFSHIFSKTDKDGANVIMSRFPIISSGEFNPTLPNGKTLGKIQWANIKIEDKILRIYNSHFEIDGAGPKERMYLLNFIISQANNHPGGVIICGDLNTTIPKKGFGRKIVQLFHFEEDENLMIDGKIIDKDERYKFSEVALKEGFSDALDIEETTWCIDLFHYEMFNLKLDWFLTRDIKINKVTMGKYISDHKSVLVECSII